MISKLLLQTIAITNRCGLDGYIDTNSINDIS